MMEAVQQWGLEVIGLVQRLQSPPLTAVMRLISCLGDPAFYFALILLLYWCVDSRRGFILGVAIIFSGALNTALKETLRVPRPFVRDPSVFIMEESGFSTPSGHSQGSAAFYPLVACLTALRRRGGRSAPRVAARLALAVGLPLLIGFTRVYLGVHYPSDVLLGLTLGFLTSLGLALFWNPAASAVAAWRPSLQLLASGAAVLVLNHFSQGEVRLGGALLGFLAGRIFWARSGKFWSAGGTCKRRLLRLPLGLSVTGAAFLAIGAAGNLLGRLLPAVEPARLVQFIQFAAAGFSLVYLCPRLFVRLGLARLQAGDADSGDGDSDSAVAGKDAARSDSDDGGGATGSWP